ncbi:MAG TPA: hypothetical protein VK956_16470 [Verrucomicrobium sp.]|nr:hypothetical protein [Verrucomicrobium sp.]
MQDKIKATKKEIQGKIATTTTTLGEARAERDNIKDTAKQLKSSVKDLKAQLATLDAQISAKGGGPVDRGIVESRAHIDSDLRDFETEADRLDTTLSEMDASIDTMDKSLTTLGERLQKSDDLLTDIDAVLKNLAVTGRMKGRNAEKDLTSYNDSVPLERAKMVKSLWDGQKAITDIGMLSSGAGTVAAEGFKLASGVTGVVVGPLTMAVNSYEMYNDVNERNVQLALKAQSTKVLKSTTGIKQDDGELLAIAERLKLKQTKQSVDKGLSATKNFFGALGGAGTAVAGGVAIAVTAGAVATTASAVLIATPIGWGLAGAAALAAIGYGIYKLARHVNSSGIKEALQTTLKNVQGKDPATKVGDLGLTGKDAKAMGKITDKMIKALAAQGITATADQFTVQDVQNYASKKLLARDTGVATASLYHRFKEETGAHFRQKGITNPTADDFDAYLKDRKAETPVSTAAGLISTLGFSMSKEEALDLYRDSSSSDSIKFLSKKLKLS